MVLSVMINDALAGTEIVDAIGKAVPPKAAALYKLIVMLAADVPLVLATTIELILSTVPLAAALLAIDVADVVLSDVELVLP